MDLLSANLNELHARAMEEAQTASNEMLRRIGGDRYACGFAWVSITPKNKGNTKLGKAERAALVKLGFRQDYTGKSYQLWNPGKLNVQNVDTKEAGAEAYAQVFREQGISCYAESRLD